MVIEIHLAKQGSAHLVKLIFAILTCSLKTYSNRHIWSSTSELYQPPSFAFSVDRGSPNFFAIRHRIGSLPAFAAGDVSTRIHPTTEWLSLFPNSSTRIPFSVPYGFR